MGQSSDATSPLGRTVSLSMRLSPEDTVARTVSMSMRRPSRHSYPLNQNELLPDDPSARSLQSRTRSMTLNSVGTLPNSKSVKPAPPAALPTSIPLLSSPRNPEVKGAGGAPIKVGDAVWVRDKSAQVFAKGTMKSASSPRVCTITMEATGAIIQKQAVELYPANATDDAPDDHSTLTHLNEPCVLDSTARRFSSDAIYTYVGRILVAVNPCHQLDIYDDEAIAAHVGAPTSAPPHVYGVAERAYVRLQGLRTMPQSIVMSGESGAGKTETTRYILRYLATRASDISVATMSSDAVLESANITEAFGNAKTRRNDNSSRFGKLIQLSFSNGAVASATIRTFLLERSRVTQVSVGERSFHVLYQLLAANKASVRSATRLESVDAKSCRVLASSQCLTIAGVSDSERFTDLDVALTKIGLAEETREALYAMVATVIHLGNLDFVPTIQENADTGSEIADEAADALGATIDLLGCNTLNSLLTTNTITMGRQSAVTRPLSVAEAARTRDAVIRALFSRVFAWLETQLNQCCLGDASAGKRPSNGGDTVEHGISLLDIFGFERYEANGFEQLCINFANEKLQQYFLHCVFKNEQEICKAEGVRFPKVDYSDNEGCVDVIEKVTKSGPGASLAVHDDSSSKPHACPLPLTVLVVHDVVSRRAAVARVAV